MAQRCSNLIRLQIILIVGLIFTSINSFLLLFSSREPKQSRRFQQEVFANNKLPNKNGKKKRRESRGATQKWSSSLLYLNATNATLLRQNEITRNAEQHWSNNKKHSVDVLIVGSKYKISAAQTQFDTWGSHPSIRHFVLSTEDDHMDPSCHLHTTWEDVKDHSRLCYQKLRHWDRNLHALNPLTSLFTTIYAKIPWLEEKANPAGWLCAQQRFISSYTNFVEMYSNQESNLPDYLLVADDDTFVNMDHITEYLLEHPEKGAMSLKIEGDPTNYSYVANSNIPVVYAGCKVEHNPRAEVGLTLPFGGYGVFFSRGSLRRLTRPLYCTRMDGSRISDATEEEEKSPLAASASFQESSSSLEDFEFNICQKYQNRTSLPHPHDITLGEEYYFKAGDTLNQVFDKYMNGIGPHQFCVHSDWVFAYLANFLNLSRLETSDWIAQLDFPTPNNRLHSIYGSAMYGETINGECRHGENGQSPCHGNATVCHYVNETDMKRFYKEYKQETY